jgi:hypothetical protein
MGEKASFEPRVRAMQHFRDWNIAPFPAACPERIKE